MSPNLPFVDPYLFEKQFKAFCAFVKAKSDMIFTSFASHPYMIKEEGYKDDLWKAGFDTLAILNWRSSDIGSGRIAERVISAIQLQIPVNNLVRWQAQYGEAAQPHRKLLDAVSTKTNLHQIEAPLYALYRSNDDHQAFDELVAICGKKYSLIAYLLFLKDRSKYLPIATTYFDNAFAILGVDFTTSYKCSWQNYSTFIGIIAQLKAMLSDVLETEITLLDAHSFAWVLASQMKEEGALADNSAYLSLPPSERTALIKARIGQGRYREELLAFWKSCAVTQCEAKQLLTASHIKPWAKGTTAERLDSYNGLLLSPSLNACFDCGLISFTDDGQILLSKSLAASDMSALGINVNMQLRAMDSRHKPYLAYHRENIFK